MNKLVNFTLSIVLSTFCSAALAEPVPNPIHTYQLNNGLQLIVKEDHRAPIVSSQIWYRIGASYEPAGITGISHALEHMMFEGTPQHPDNDFSRIIEKTGGDENASTSDDYTFYYQDLAADRLATSFELEADRMQNLALTKEAFAKEIEVVKEERRLRTDNNPQALTYERFSAMAFMSNPYHHPVVGWMNDLNNMTVEDLHKWYAQWYSPNNATVVVVGDVKPDEVYQLAQKYFGSIPKRDLPIIKPFRDVLGIGNRNITVKTPAKLPWLVLGFNTPSLTTAKEPWHAYALEVASAILSQGNSSRLPRDLIRGKQLASETSASYDLYSRLPSLFMFEGTPTSTHTIDQLKEAILLEIKQLQDQLVSADELARVKTQLIAQKTYGQDSVSDQASEIGSIVSVGLDLKVIDEYKDEINKITPQQIQEVSRKYMIPERMTEGQLSPLPIDSQTAAKAAASNFELGASNVH